MTDNNSGSTPPNTETGNTEGLREYSLAEIFGDQKASFIESMDDHCPACFATETGAPEIVWVTDWGCCALLFTCPSCGEKFLLRLVDPAAAATEAGSDGQL